MTVANADPATPTEDVIVIEGGTEDDPIEVTLDGVNIAVGDAGGSALTIQAGDSGEYAPSHVTLVLAEDRVNTLKASPAGGWTSVPAHAVDLAAGGYGGTGSNNTLTITGSGTLNAYGSNDGFPDGGGSGIYGGKYSVVTIEGGAVNAYGYGNKGGGITGYGGEGSKIVITGGDVSAWVEGNSNDEGAAIGGSVEAVEISGGTVTAVSKNGGSAIGSADGMTSSNIFISGGAVTATAEGSGAAIGGGEISSTRNTIKITGGSVTATAADGVAIGWDEGGEEDLWGDPISAELTISGGTVYAESKNGDGIGKGTAQSQVNFTSGAVIVTNAIDDELAGISGLAGVVLEGTGLGPNDFTVSGDTVTVDGGVTVPAGGTANIVVASGKTLAGAITNNGALTVRAEGNVGAVTNGAEAVLENAGSGDLSLTGGESLAAGNVLAGGCQITPAASGEKPSVNSDGTVTIPGGSEIGSVAVPDGFSVKVMLDSVGAVAAGDGSLSLPAGSSVLKDGAEIFLPSGSTVDSDGAPADGAASMTIKDGTISVALGEKTLTLDEGSWTLDRGAGKVTVPVRGHGSDSEGGKVYFSKGAKIGPGGELTLAETNGRGGYMVTEYDASVELFDGEETYVIEDLKAEKRISNNAGVLTLFGVKEGTTVKTEDGQLVAVALDEGSLAVNSVPFWQGANWAAYALVLPTEDGEAQQVKIYTGNTVVGSTHGVVTLPDGEDADLTELVDFENDTLNIPGGSTIEFQNADGGVKGTVLVEDDVTAVSGDTLQIQLGGGADGSVTVNGKGEVLVKDGDGSEAAVINPAGGTVTVSGGVVEAPAGSSVTTTGEDGEQVVTELPNGGSVSGDGEVEPTPPAPPTSGNPSYSVTVAAGIEHGAVTVSASSAAAGSTVSVAVSPDAGYVLGELSVSGPGGRPLAVTRVSDTKYTFTMPHSNVTVSASFERSASAFTDVPAGAYYAGAVAWAVENGVTNGVSATEFSPEGAVTRAQAVTFLWRAAGCPEPESEANPFADVAAGAYYYDAVLWAVENGVTTGTSATEFSPDGVVTRAQAVTFLWRAAGCPESEGEAKPFADVAAGAYYCDAVLWAVENGVTNGVSATEFGPDGAVTRAQAATFLYRQLA